MPKSKIESRKSKARGLRATGFIPVFFAPALLLAGCSLLSPGQDTRAALETQNLTSYDKDSAFTSKEATTSSRRNLVAEGTKVGAMFYADGTPQFVNDATHIMSQASDPRDAASAKMHLDELNAQVGLGLINAMQQMIGFMSAQRAVSDVSSDVSSLLRDQQIVEALKRLGMNPPPPLAPTTRPGKTPG